MPPFAELSSREPHPQLRYHLPDLLFAYCYTLRLFNGDWEGLEEEAAATLMRVSCLLGAVDSGTGHPPEGYQGVQVHESTGAALQRCVENTCQPAVWDSSAFTRSVLRDVGLLLLPEAALQEGDQELRVLTLDTVSPGQEALDAVSLRVQAALGHSVRLCSRAATGQEGGGGPVPAGASGRRPLQLAKRKLTFCLAYTRDVLGSEGLLEIGAECWAEVWRRQELEERSPSEWQRQQEQNSPPPPHRPIIQVITTPQDR